jgi:uncharacterized protein with HEPN domain
MLKNDLAYIEHMILCIRKIHKFTKGINRKEFEKNELIQDAVIRNIEIIGEACKKLSSDYKNTYRDIEWKEIAGMRDKLIHDYFGVDIKVIWETVKIDIPELLKKLKGLN